MGLRTVVDFKAPEMCHSRANRNFERRKKYIGRADWGRDTCNSTAVIAVSFFMCSGAVVGFIPSCALS